MLLLFPLFFLSFCISVEWGLCFISQSNIAIIPTSITPFAAADSLFFSASFFSLLLLLLNERSRREGSSGGRRGSGGNSTFFFFPALLRTGRGRFCVFDFVSVLNEVAELLRRLRQLILLLLYQNLTLSLFPGVSAALYRSRYRYIDRRTVVGLFFCIDSSIYLPGSIPFIFLKLKREYTYKYTRRKINPLFFFAPPHSALRKSSCSSRSSCSLLRAAVCIGRGLTPPITPSSPFFF